MITVRGLALLRGADVVVYDRLVSKELLRFVRDDAELIFAGKSPRAHAMTQPRINRTLIARARAGRTVVRLKGGDPFVFGRGGEEAEAVAGAGIPLEIVPGVTSAAAAPAVAGIPVTHRDLAASVGIATAHEARGAAGARIDWRALAALDTIVLLMGVERLPDVTRGLIDAGRSPRTPAAVIQDATLPTQRTVVAPLSRLATAARRAGIRAPAVTVVGDVVGVRGSIGGWDTRPLAGVRVLVTRTRAQASELSGTLRELGAEVIESPAIRVLPPRSWTAVDRAIAGVRSGRYAWIVFTSANGVRAFASRLRRAKLDARALGTAKIAAIGPGTAETLADLGIVADLVPRTFTTAAIGKTFPRGAGRVLLARAGGVDRLLDDAVRARGWTPERLTLYRLAGVGTMPATVRRAVLRGEIDVLTFASGGTVMAFMRALRGKPAKGTKVVVIGPVTAQVARKAGLRVHAEADPHSITALAAAVVQVVRR